MTKKEIKEFTTDIGVELDNMVESITQNRKHNMVESITQNRKT